ncbi:MAG: DNA damage-inducible protein D [Chloroflexota bacterium]|nr:DNA damage-inducible protein D [Chloroflexota bacterium]
MDTNTPDFESLRQITPYETEYWSARALAPLLGYTRWQNFEQAINRAMTACRQIGQPVEDHFTGISKMVALGSGAQREIKDYLLSRFACYLIAQNGDPRKPQIAHAQAYFATATRQNELAQLYDDQQQRLRLRERVSEDNHDLAAAAAQAGVLSRNFGVFQNAGYEGLYNGQDVAALKERKGIGANENILDRMGRAELAANDFRITQTEAKLRKEGVIGQRAAMDTHYEVGRTVRRAIEEIGGTMPEDLPAEPSIAPLLNSARRRRKKLATDTPSDAAGPQQGSLWDA